MRATDMPLYRFSVHGGNVTHEVSAELPDDGSAWDHGEAVVRGLLQHFPDLDQSRVLVISVGDRVVGSFSFNQAGVERRLLH